MKKIILAIILASRGFCLTAKTGFERDVIFLEIGFDPLKVERCLDYSIVRSPGCRASYKAGDPLLPIKELFLLLPPDAEISDVKVFS
ncbi:MAG: hypothetical protein AB1630_07160 [bacterium]